MCCFKFFALFLFILAGLETGATVSNGVSSERKACIDALSADSALTADEAFKKLNSLVFIISKLGSNYVEIAEMTTWAELLTQEQRELLALEVASQIRGASKYYQRTGQGMIAPKRALAKFLASFQPSTQDLLRNVKDSPRQSYQRYLEAQKHIFSTADPKLGRYSFEQVEMVLKLIAESYQKSSKREELRLFGSFFNGYADLSTSDIDILSLDQELVAELTSPGMNNKIRALFYTSWTRRFFGQPINLHIENYPHRRPLIAQSSQDYLDSVGYQVGRTSLVQFVINREGIFIEVRDPRNPEQFVRTLYR